MLDLIGHVAYVSIFVGMCLISRQRVGGWVFRFLGEATWVGLGVAMDMTSIWVWGIVFAVVDVYGFFTWRVDARKS